MNFTNLKFLWILFVCLALGACIFSFDDKESSKTDNTAKEDTLRYGEGDFSEAIEESDSLGNIVRRIWTDEDGKTLREILYEHDEKGLVIREEVRDMNNGESYTMEYDHDTDGNVIYEFKYNAKGVAQGGNRYEYDSEGNRTLVQDLDDQGEIVHAEHFDSKNRRIEVIYYDAGNIRDRETLKYGPKGFVVTIVRYRADGTKISLRENSDEENPWTMREVSYNEQGNPLYETKYNSKDQRAEEWNYWPGGVLESIRWLNTEGLDVKLLTWNEAGSFESLRETDFDSKNREIESRYYDSDSSLTNRNVTMYDDSDNVTRSEVWNSDGILSYANDYLYRSDGTLQEESYYGNNGILERISRYDEQGRITEKESFEAGYEGLTTYVLDETGRSISETHYDTNGVFLYRNTLEYDNEGRKIRVSSYDESDKLLSATSTEYDANGFESRLEWFDSTGVSTGAVEYLRNGSVILESIYFTALGVEDYRYVYTYAADGQNNSQETWKNGVLTTRIEWEYDGSGSLVQKTITDYDSSGNIVSNRIYDAAGKQLN